jgi:hypothetical protein
MLAAGGICEFGSPTEACGRCEAQISPASARASDGLLNRHERIKGLPGSGYFFGAKAGGSGSPRFSTAARVVISTHSSPSLSCTM